MFSAKRALATAGAFAVVAAGLTGTAHAATVSPRGCTNHSYFSTWGGHRIFLVKPNTRRHVYTVGAIGRGVTLHLTVSGGTTVSTEITKTWGSSVGVNIDVIAASAHSDISRAITVTRTNSVTLGADYTTHTNHGFLSYGSYGYSYEWLAGYINSACRAIVTARGAGKSPGPAGEPTFFWGRG